MDLAPFIKTGIIIALAGIFVNVTAKIITITFSKSTENKKRPGSTLYLVLPINLTDPGLFLSCRVRFVLAGACEAALEQNGVLPHVHPAYWTHPFWLLPW